MRAELWTTATPDELPESGAGIAGLGENDSFAAGSKLICTTSKEVYFVGEHGDDFELWGETEPSDAGDVT